MIYTSTKMTLKNKTFEIMSKLIFAFHTFCINQNEFTNSRPFSKHFTYHVKMFLKKKKKKQFGLFLLFCVQGGIKKIILIIYSVSKKKTYTGIHIFA
jgi:hypothetical protein